MAEAEASNGAGRGQGQGQELGQGSGAGVRGRGWLGLALTSVAGPAPTSLLLQVYCDAHDEALGWSQRCNRFGPWYKFQTERSLGLGVFEFYERSPQDPTVASTPRTNPFNDDQKRWLDLDVIDTTWIENNVQVWAGAGVQELGPGMHWTKGAQRLASISFRQGEGVPPDPPPHSSLSQLKSRGVRAFLGGTWLFSSALSAHIEEAALSLISEWQFCSRSKAPAALAAFALRFPSWAAAPLKACKIQMDSKAQSNGHTTRKKPPPHCL